MNIFLDARFYRRSGIGRYIEGLYMGIIDNKSSMEIFAAGDSSLLNESFLKTQHIIDYHSSIYSLSEQIKGSLLVNKVKRSVDVFHIPHYNAPWFLPKNSVVTVHDLTQFIFPEFFGRVKPVVAKIVLRNALKKAGMIIAGSESTKKDIVKHYPEIEGKIRVIYNGISVDFKPLSENEVNEFKRNKGLADYILYVGNRKQTKNLRRLLEAFSIIKSEYRNLKLVIIGERFSSFDEVDKGIAEFNLKGLVVVVLKVSDEELHRYYCGAKLLVHPSLYEGFGFTPLEAMACGIPAVVSNISSLPEVYGDAALYFDPYDISDMINKIKIVIRDTTLQKVLVNRGLQLTKVFTWERCANETLKVFEEVYVNEKIR